MSTVVLVGTIDTKGREVRFVRDCLLAAGVTPLVIDIGVTESRHDVGRVDIPASEVARAGGADLASLRNKGEQDNSRARALQIMANGLSRILPNLREAGRLDAVLGFGGSSGSSVIAAAFQALAIGVPKLLVSTMAAGDVSPYVGTRDVTLMYSVVDIAGLNAISSVVLRNAAHAAAGMARGAAIPSTVEGDSESLIGITMFGVTTTAVTAIQAALEAEGLGTTVFHATGAGGQAMEHLVRDGLLAGVVDLTTSELTDEIVGGVLSAGPDRMEAAGSIGLPQILVPGALEIVNFGAEATVPAPFRVPERRLHVHNAAVTIVRTTAEESSAIGRIFAEKANKSTGPTVVMLPLRGLSAIDAPGQPYEDVEADQALFHAIRSTLRDDIKLVEVDAAINDVDFTDAVIREFLSIWRSR